MKGQSILISICILFVLPIFSQNTLLWEISGKKAKGKSYLYGTMHTTDARAFEFNDSLKIVFKLCAAFAMEFTPDQKNMDKVLSNMYLEKGVTLKDLYSPTDYAFLESAIKDELGINIRMLEKMKPFFIMSMFMQKTMRNDKPHFVDSYLYNMAIEKGMKTISIEKVKEQITAIKSSPPQALIDYIKEIGSAVEQMDELIGAYRTQDLERMLLISEQDTSDIQMMEALLTNRNHTMTKRIRKIIRKQPTFIAVGALHLPGKEGIIELLKKNGLKVRPIYAPYNSLNNNS